MKPKRKRRTFTAEFKANTVRLIRESGRSIGEVAKDLELTETAVRHWVKQAKIDAGHGPAGAPTTAESAELMRLRRENKRIHSPCPVVKVGEKSELIVVEEQYGSTTKAAIRTNYSSPGTATLPVQRRAQA